MAGVVVMYTTGRSDYSRLPESLIRLSSRKPAGKLPPQGSLPACTARGGTMFLTLRTVIRRPSFSEAMLIGIIIVDYYGERKKVI